MMTFFAFIIPAVICFFMGIDVFVHAKSAIHEIQGQLYFIMSILLVSTSFIFSIVKDVLDAIKSNSSPKPDRSGE